MRYKRFRIQNFKGIKDATVDLGDSKVTSVYALVGLNESGKTTILEAIHSFSPDAATSELVGGDAESGVPIKDRVPRHLYSSFTGDVSVEATVSVDENDLAKASKRLLDTYGIRINLEEPPKEIIFERHQRFKSGDFVKSYFSMRTEFKIKSGKQKNWRNPTYEEKEHIKSAFYILTPDIAYFPTFVFDFPSDIFLTKERNDAVNSFYRQVFQDILDYDGKGLSIEDHIVRRVRGADMVVPWLDFLNLWNKQDDRDKIQHVMDRVGAVVTDVVFGRWNKIFREDAKGKEVIISFDVVQGEKKDSKGAITKTEAHDIYVKFQIRDGTRRFDVNARSLGFRWFFAFMLFTQFRVARSSTRPIFFLFDEPASNLHAAAQQKLIESFPEIAKGPHTLVYTTHSHYMIEPRWLEQTFIVTNRSDGPPGSVLDALSLDDESLDVKAWSYRNFVNEHPNQTSYFQPILDRLEVVPSRFDIARSSVIVEGRSDYYILRYASILHKTEISLLPGLGAGTFGALVALHIGWNLRMLFLLDGDKQGKVERDRYVKDFGLPADRAVTLDELEAGTTEIEKLLNDDARKVIEVSLGLTQSPNKGQIKRFFQERIAADQVVSLGSDFAKRSKALLSKLAQQLG